MVSWQHDLSRKSWLGFFELYRQVQRKPGSLEPSGSLGDQKGRRSNKIPCKERGGAQQKMGVSEFQTPAGALLSEKRGRKLTWGEAEVYFEI